MTGPVWDGEGVDPWLPARLAAALDAARAERSIYAAVWEALSKWITEVLGRVLSGPVPQPEAIFTLAPAWSDAVDVIIEDAIKPVMGEVFEDELGEDFEDFDWEDPDVADYLAGVKNRLVRTPDEVFNLVGGQIAAGVTLGESIPELSARIDGVLSATGTERWRNRAVVIARTETIGALNAARMQSFQAIAADDPDTEYERIWLATMDTRTRETHRIADGERAPVDGPWMVGGFPLMYPGDPAGPAEEVIQCRCSQLLVEVGEDVDMSNRQMKG